MTNNSSAIFPLSTLPKSRTWLIIGGILSLVVGLASIGSPLMFSFLIAQMLAVFALGSGLISLLMATFGKGTDHRILHAISAVIRIAAGIVLLRCLTSTVLIITLIFAIFLFIEGIFFALAALRMRNEQGWIWTLISGLVSILLGGLIYIHWPSDSAWILGLFFGIKMVFSAGALLALGISPGKSTAPSS